MDETTQTPTDQPSEATEESQPTRLQYFVNQHPRAAKVVTLVGAAAAAVGVVQVARTVNARRDHLEAAGDHIGEAAREVAASVSPTDTES